MALRVLRKEEYLVSFHWERRFSFARFYKRHKTFSALTKMMQKNTFWSTIRQVRIYTKTYSFIYIILCVCCLGTIHNPQHYARDFYFFKRSQYPQLDLVHKKPAQAYVELQQQCFGLKFVEIGKVMLTWGILKNVNQVVQRVVFLHEDLMKLPSFPRKALEAELDLYTNGEMGKVRIYHEA